MLGLVGPHPELAEPTSQALRDVIEQSVHRYIADRRSAVSPFCGSHFSLAGAWRIHREALGHDLWRAPANVLWALPFLLARGAAYLGGRLGWKQAAGWLLTLPPGFKTRVASEVEWLLFTELLVLPIQQADRASGRDALMEAILAHEAMTAWLLPDLAALHQLTNSGRMRLKLESFLATYAASRTAASEIATSLLSLAAGAAAFHEFTPGAFAIGNVAASALAQHIAIAHFALGPTLGSLYYGVFPATASAGLLVGTVGGIMTVLGLLSAFTGILTDPVQNALGLQERRLHRLLTALEQQLTGSDGNFSLRDAYVARAFDVLDVVKGAVRHLRA